MNTPDWPSGDALGEALHFLRMDGVFYSRCEFSAPWGLELPPFPDCLMFHLVTSGQCGLDLEGADPVQLRAGDFVLVPHGAGHRLRGHRDTPCAKLFDLPRESVSDRYDVIRHGGGGAPVTMICGAVRFDHPAAAQFLSLLPRVLHIDAHAHYGNAMSDTLRLMANEIGALRPGGETIVTRLADILVIQSIRAWMERDPAALTGWLGALRDRQIGRAIMLIHRDPARSWTLASLAAAVAMSRSAFAARFAAMVGTPAMEYVTRWRMNTALTHFKDRDVTIADVAERVREASLRPEDVVCDVDPSLRLTTDPRVLGHALGLLVDNALKYAGDAVITASRRRVVVWDHGPGIEAARRERVFERFTRGDHTEGGMGLGLSIVRNLATAIGARVELDEAPGGGARFTLVF